MAAMPMFPLGSVLFPEMPLPLRVFEPRYLAMLRTILQDEPSEFGVVLIERGQEVGGGDHRTTIGTVARVVTIDTTVDSVLLVAVGDRRVEVERWLDDDPFPRAEVRELPALTWDDELVPLRASAEFVVRRALARATEWQDPRWPADIALSPDPLAAAWQLAAIAPVNPLDQLSMLRATSVRELLTTVITLATEAQQTW